MQIGGSRSRRTRKGVNRPGTVASRLAGASLDGYLKATNKLADSISSKMPTTRTKVRHKRR